SVVWPEADMLTGITMTILRRQLPHLGIPQRTQQITLADLPEFTGAVVMNSWTPGITVHRIASVSIPEAPSFVQTLHAAYQAERPAVPWATLTRPEERSTRAERGLGPAGRRGPARGAGRRARAAQSAPPPVRAGPVAAPRQPADPGQHRRGRA